MTRIVGYPFAGKRGWEKGSKHFSGNQGRKSVTGESATGPGKKVEAIFVLPEGVRDMRLRCFLSIVAFLFVVSSKGRKETTLLVPMLALLGDPEKFAEKRVAVVGFLERK